MMPLCMEKRKQQEGSQIRLGKKTFQKANNTRAIRFFGSM